jgi:pimeloyl-ACP methyl ester carboxylesterase
MSQPPSDPVIRDPLVFDAEYPPAYVGVTISSGGLSLFGMAYLAQGRGPHPVAIFLHGLPGYERNSDLAQAARRAGWTVVMFNYRGAWGSGGEFTLTHALEDTRMAVDWVATEPAQQLLRTDGQRVVLLGHGMGGWAALLTAVDRSNLLGVAAVAPWNVGAYANLARDSETRPAALAFIRTVTTPLKTAGAEIVLNEAVAQRSRWDVVQYAGLLRERNVLLLGGTDDSEAPPAVHFTPLVTALSGGPNVQHALIAQADHGFGARRFELTRRVVDWLEGLRRA